MPEETNSTNQTSTNDGSDKVDLNAAISAIEQKVTEKIAEGMTSLERKLQKPVQPEPEQDIFADDEDDDGYISKKDLPKLVDQISHKVSKATQVELEMQAKRGARDTQAFDEHPALKDSTSRFQKEVLKEMNRRISDGRHKNDPDLLYDSAQSVAPRGIRERWYFPPDQARQASVSRAGRDDNFSVSGGDSSGATVTEGMLRFAQRSGLSPERVKQHIGKTSFFRKK